MISLRKNSREELRVSLDEFRGHRLLNLRVWFEGEDGSMRPGKQGVAVRIEMAGDLRTHGARHAHPRLGGRPAGLLGAGRRAPGQADSRRAPGPRLGRPDGLRRRGGGGHRRARPRALSRGRLAAGAALRPGGRGGFLVGPRLARGAAGLPAGLLPGAACEQSGGVPRLRAGRAAA